MTERPRELVIGPSKYRILWQLKETNRLRHVDSESSLGGQVFHTEQYILMDESVHESYARRVLVHEVLHCIIENVGGLGIPPDVMKEDRVIDRLEPGLLEVLRRNPSLVAWLSAEDAP